MTNIKETIQNYNASVKAFNTIDFQSALEAYLPTYLASGKTISTGVNEKLALEEKVKAIFSFTDFWLSETQDNHEGLELAYGPRPLSWDDVEETSGYIVIPWAYFPNETSATEAQEDYSPGAPIALALNSYVRKRGISMPVYTNGSKILEEAGELQQAVQQAMNGQLDLPNLKEEVADVVITAAVAAQQFSFTVEEALLWKIKKDTGRNEIN